LLCLRPTDCHHQKEQFSSRHQKPQGRPPVSPTDTIAPTQLFLVVIWSRFMAKRYIAMTRNPRCTKHQCINNNCSLSARKHFLARRRRTCRMMCTSSCLWENRQIVAGQVTHPFAVLRPRRGGALGCMQFAPRDCKFRAGRVRQARFGV
jgi:hypothetical protein